MDALLSSETPNISNTKDVQELFDITPNNLESFPQPILDLNHYEHIIIITWNSLIGFIAILGNTVVLISSIEYNAIHLDRVSIILIRNLAAADLGLGLSLIAVSVNPTIARGGKDFGSHLCVGFSLLAAMYLGASSNLLAGLNMNKVSVLLFPLRSTMRSFKRGYVYSGVIWVFTTLLLTACFMYTMFSPDDYSVELNEYDLRCTVKNPDISMRFLLTSVQICFMIMPVVIVAVTTIWMGCFVRRVRGIQRQTIRTLLVVSITFSISLAPGIFFSVLSPALDLDLNKIQSRKWYHTLRIVSPLAVCINCAANPFIYCVTIPSFGGFVKMKLRYAGNIVRVFMLPWLRLRRHRIRISDMAVRVRRTAESEL